MFHDHAMDKNVHFAQGGRTPKCLAPCYGGRPRATGPSIQSSMSEFSFNGEPQAQPVTDGLPLTDLDDGPRAITGQVSSSCVALKLGCPAATKPEVATRYKCCQDKQDKTGRFWNRSEFKLDETIPALQSRSRGSAGECSEKRRTTCP